MKKSAFMVIFLCICTALLIGCGGGEKKNGAGSNEIKEFFDLITSGTVFQIGRAHV